MARPPQFPPKLIRKPGTAHARTCYRGTYYHCGAWDTRTNQPSPDAYAKWRDLVDLWSRDPDAVPGGEYRLTALLLDWLQSPDGPVHDDDRNWIPPIIERLCEWRDGIGADQFGGPQAEEWQAWLCGLVKDGKQRYNRTSVKRCVSFVRRAVKWGARMKLHGITWEQYHELEAVPPPKPGRVREPLPVLPVSWDAIVRTVPQLHPQLQVITWLLWWTGARPKELLTLKLGQIQSSGTLEIPKVPPVKLGQVWAAHVPSKAKRLGHARVLFFGPRAQAVLGWWLCRERIEPTDYLFAPLRGLTRAEGERRSRKVGKVYGVKVIRYAVARACERAKCDHWHPSQIRHAASARIRGAMGEDAEAAMLGHGGKAITQRYAGLDSELAARVALKLG